LRVLRAGAGGAKQGWESQRRKQQNLMSVNMPPISFRFRVAESVLPIPFAMLVERHHPMSDPDQSEISVAHNCIAAVLHCGKRGPYSGPMRTLAATQRTMRNVRHAASFPIRAVHDAVANRGDK